MQSVKQFNACCLHNGKSLPRNACRAVNKLPSRSVAKCINLVFTACRTRVRGRRELKKKSGRKGSFGRKLQFFERQQQISDRKDNGCSVV